MSDKIVQLNKNLTKYDLKILVCNNIYVVSASFRTNTGIINSAHRFISRYEYEALLETMDGDGIGYYNNECYCKSNRIVAKSV